MNEVPNVIYVMLFGEYDAGRCAELKRQLGAAHDADIALLDMREVTFCDARAMECFAGLKKRMTWRAEAASIRLVGANGATAALVQSGLSGAREAYANIGAALESLGSLRCADGEVRIPAWEPAVSSA